MAGWSGGKFGPARDGEAEVAKRGQDVVPDERERMQVAARGRGPAGQGEVEGTPAQIGFPKGSLDRDEAFLELGLDLALQLVDLLADALLGVGRDCPHEPQELREVALLTEHPRVSFTQRLLGRGGGERFAETCAELR